MKEDFLRSNKKLIAEILGIQYSKCHSLILRLLIWKMRLLIFNDSLRLLNGNYRLNNSNSPC